MICLELITISGSSVLAVPTQPETCPYVAYTKAEADTLLSINSLFTTYFEFDAELFQQITIYMLLAFAAGLVMAAITKVFNQS